VLNEAQAQAAKQTELTNSRVQIQISESQGEADLARARKQAEQTVVVAEAELARARRQAEQMVVLAQADSEQKVLAGRGEAKQVMQVGLSEASVLQRKIASFGDSRLYALEQLGEYLSKSKQPLVPERVFVSGGNGDTSQLSQTNGILGLLLNLLVAEKSGFEIGSVEQTDLKTFSDRMAREMIESMSKEDVQVPTPRTASNGK
jgi:uncharacterized membrane protein YqiK